MIVCLANQRPPRHRADRPRGPVPLGGPLQAGHGGVRRVSVPARMGLRQVQGNRRRQRGSPAVVRDDMERCRFIDRCDLERG